MDEGREMKGRKAEAAAGGLTEPLVERSASDFQSPGKAEDIKNEVATSDFSFLLTQRRTLRKTEGKEQDIAMTLTPDVMVACPEKPVQEEDFLHKSWSLLLIKLSGCQNNSGGSKYKTCWGKGTHSTTQNSPATF